MNFTILQNFDIPIVGRSFLTSKNPEFFCISISPQKKPYLCPEHFFQVCKLVICCESHVFGQMRQQFEIKFVNYILLQVYCRFRSNLSEQTLRKMAPSLKTLRKLIKRLFFLSGTSFAFNLGLGQTIWQTFFKFSAIRGLVTRIRV